MKRLLICTDFSDSADHAARFGCMIARHYKVGAITLFHSYQMMVVPAMGSAVDSSYTYVANEPALEDVLAQLNNLKNDLGKLAGSGTAIRVRAESMTLPENFDAICKEENADMIITGVSSKSALEKAIVGSNAITISKTSKYPVLIVPEQAPIEPVRSVLFACDLNELSAITPLGLLGEVLELFNAPLIVLNVDYKNRRFSSETPDKMHQMHHIFDKYKPVYAFMDRKDITDGIVEYAKTNKISLILTIPKNYNFIEELLHRSTTKKLIWQSPVPVLTLHE